MAKKFYWLKLQQKFFNQKPIKALRQMEKGSTYIIVYLKMLIYSLENSNKLYFDYVKDTFVEEIALSIDEKVEDVDFTLKFLEKVNLIEYTSDDELEFLQVEEFTGKESDSAARMRKLRKKNKCDENVTLEKEKEIEIDKEIDNTPSMCVDENLKKIIKLYEENIGSIYPVNRDWFIETGEQIDAGLFEEAIKICIDKNNVTAGYLKGIIKKWINDNIFTLKDYKAKEKERQNRKNMFKGKDKKEEVEEKIDNNIIEEIKAMEAKMEA